MYNNAKVAALRIEIVAEEADIYYNGDKSLEDVTAVIQNRVELLLKETY